MTTFMAVSLETCTYIAVPVQPTVFTVLPQKRC